MIFPPCSFADLWNMATLFSAHGGCLLWNPWLIGGLILGSMMFVVAYIKIPLVYRRVIREHPSVSRNAEYRRVYLWSGWFIFLCAVTHALFIITLFRGGQWYYLEALALIVGGTVSLYTAWRVVPRLLDILTARETAMARFTETIAQLTRASTEDAYTTLHKLLSEVAEHLDELNALQERRAR